MFWKKNKQEELERELKEFLVNVKKDTKIFVEVYGKSYKGLDYSEKSLEILDRIIKDVAFKSKEPIPDAAIWGFGSYAGEVIKRNLGGEWGKDPIVGFGLNNVGVVGCRVNPFIRIKKCFKEDEKIVFWYKYIKAQIQLAKKYPKDIAKILKTKPELFSEIFKQITLSDKPK